MRKPGRLGQSNAQPPFTVQDGSQKGSNAFRPLLCKKVTLLHFPLHPSPFVWNPLCLSAFPEVKGCRIPSPSLHHPSPGSKRRRIYTLHNSKKSSNRCRINAVSNGLKITWYKIYAACPVQAWRGTCPAHWLARPSGRAGHCAGNKL